MASRSQTRKHHQWKRNRRTALNVPTDIWDEIISKLNHRDRHLQPLSRVSKLFLSLTNRHKQTLNISNPTAHLLPSLFHRFPNLKHLSLSDFRGDPSPVLLQLASFNYRLQSLNLCYHHHRLPVEALQRLPQCTLSGVTSLKIRSQSDVSSAELLIIANLFPCLDELDLGPNYDNIIDDNDHGNNDYYDEGISVLTSKLTGLKRIYLEGSRWISDKGLISLSKNCPNLEGISVKGNNYDLSLSGIKYALGACRNLKMFRLECWWYELVADIGEPLSRALCLSEIDISYVPVSDGMLLALAKARLPLKSFSLDDCYDFTYDGISSFLTSYNSLNHLALKGVVFLSDESMITLAKSLTQVRSVNLDRCTDLSDSTLHTLIKGCHLLETIEMTHANIGKRKGFKWSDVINTKITTLDLSVNKCLGNESLKMISLACPNLQTLRLRYCNRITAKGVGETLRNCPGLKQLEINGCKNVKNLHLTEINTHELEFLEASRTGLNDNALINISKTCPDLMFLNVMGCVRLTSEGVGVVVDKCTKLKEINMAKCRNMSRHIFASMIFSRPSLRKIVPPEDNVLSADEENLFMRHGCYVANPRYEYEYEYI